MIARRFSPRTLILLTTAVVFATFSASAQVSSGVEIDYAREIAPIFAQHCSDCHGAERAENDFRLDTAAALREDLASPFPILGDTLESNELYLRITSNDPVYRMPAERPPLSANEIDLIRRWIEQGMPLNEAAPTEDTPALAVYAKLVDLYDLLYSDPKWMVFLFLLLGTNVAILVVERQKRRFRESDSSASPLLRIGAVHYLFIWTLLALLGGYLYHDAAMARGREALEDVWALVQQAEKFQPGEDVEVQYGNPPIPQRMNHPKAVQRAYYRGNDERNPRLFNGGYYRTSTMHVRLVHADGIPINVGDAIRPDEAFVEYSFDRAPHTMAALYSDFILKTIFASNRYPWDEAENDPDLARVEVVEPEQLWRLRYPLAAGGNTAESIEGLVYIYYRGRPHYGIGYEIKIGDGVLMEGSDVWLGNLWMLGNLLPPVPKGYVTQREWVDFRPIPEIPEPQTVTDPHTLGATEHLGPDYR